jgi:hypothetical protein
MKRGGPETGESRGHEARSKLYLVAQQIAAATE